jgi:hypothetical protein
MASTLTFTMIFLCSSPANWGVYTGLYYADILGVPEVWDLETIEITAHR